MFERFDLFFFRLVNDWSGSWALDQIIAYEQGDNLFKGGLVLAVYWYFWFADSPRRDKRRRTVVAAVLGVVAALALCRAIAAVLPFRVRPMYETGILYHPPSIAMPFNFEQWSSFPSDTATYFFALAAGAYALSRPLGVLLMAYSAIWVCLPRLYLGVHYPSDLIAGALIGVACAWAMQTWGGRRAAGPVLAAERSHPGLFYAAMFMLSYEMATIFEDVRFVLRGVAHHLPFIARAVAGRTAELSAAGAILLLVLATGIAWAKRRSRSNGAGKSELTTSAPIDGKP